MAIDRPPANTILVDAATEMIDEQRAGLDDLMQQDVTYLLTKIRRLEAMLEIVTDIVDNMEVREPQTNMAAREGIDSVEDYW